MQHPNEFIRGNTLRFLCKLREPELIEPLLSSARSCLEHRHAYVRKNAVFAVAAIFQHSPALIPDAADLIATFLESENDPTSKRNAFAALASIDHDKALAYLSSVFDGIPNADELLQLVELEFIRKGRRAELAEQGMPVGFARETPPARLPLTLTRRRPGICA